MVRTQISLSEEDVELLDRVERATGASRAEAIRRAVRAQYGTGYRRAATAAERREIVERSAGAWAGRTFTGEEYVRAIRSGDMNANLRKLGA